MNTICELYWDPVFTFVRSQGHSEADAQDLTQAFFTNFLEKNAVRAADRQRGRFRAFLLGSVKHFLSHERERNMAQKRGGGIPHVSIDATSASLFVQERLAAGDTPEQLFERRWTLHLLDIALEQLQHEWKQKKRAREFEVLVEFLDAPGETDYHLAAAQLEIERGAARVRVFRFRKRFSQLVRQLMEHSEGPAPPPSSPQNPPRSPASSGAASPSEPREDILHLKGILAR